MAEIQEIATKLLEATKQGKVTWQTTAVEDAFVAVIGERSVVMESFRDGWEEGVRLKILDKEGRELEALTNFQKIEGKVWGIELWELYNAARRVALGTENHLKELLSELDART